MKPKPKTPRVVWVVMRGDVPIVVCRSHRYAMAWCGLVFNAENTVVRFVEAPR